MCRRAWVLVLIVVLAAACVGTREADDPDRAPGLANPASEYCEDHGGRLEIRASDAGGEIGMCVFPSGAACDEWAFMRGDCTPDDVGG